MSDNEWDEENKNKRKEAARCFLIATSVPHGIVTRSSLSVRRFALQRVT